jgi:hypothetical protein
MGQDINHSSIDNHLFDSIGSDLPLDVISKINQEANLEAQKILKGTTGTSYHFAIAIGYKLCKVNQIKNEKNI